MPPLSDRIPIPSESPAPPLTVSEPATSMNIFQAAVLGVVEGVTEYLPVSSTGHLIVTQRLLGIPLDSEQAKTAADAFAISVQGGAILAVLGLYLPSVKRMVMGCIGRDPDGLRLALSLLVAFLPAAVLGLTFGSWVKENLFTMWAVVAAWIVGGIAILFFARKPDPTAPQQTGLPIPTMNQAFLIGLLQCVAMWPGTSRSLMVIVGGVLVGMGLRRAVEFSFLLGVITLGAATAKDTLDHGELMWETYGPAALAVGFIASTVSAFVAVKWLIHYITRHGMQIFGYYRIAVGLAVGAALWFGILPNR